MMSGSPESISMWPPGLQQSLYVSSEDGQDGLPVAEADHGTFFPEGGGSLSHLFPPHPGPQPMFNQVPRFYTQV